MAERAVIADDLAAYDQLPKAIRRLIDEAPLNFHAGNVLLTLREHGVAVTIREIKKTIKQALTAAKRERIG